MRSECDHPKRQTLLAHSEPALSASQVLRNPPVVLVCGLMLVAVLVGRLFKPVRGLLSPVRLRSCVLAAICLLSGGGETLGASWPAPEIVAIEANWSVLAWPATYDEETVGCKYYLVHRSEDGIGYSLAGTAYAGSGNGLTDTRSFWDRGLTSGKVYTYRVVGVSSTVFSDPFSCRASPHECFLAPVSASVYSAPVSATAMSGSEPVGTVFSESGDGWVRLTWNTVPFPGEQGVSIYRIFRATLASGGEWTEMVVANTSSFLDLDLANLQSYYYMFFPCCPERSPSYLSAIPFARGRGNGTPTVQVE